MFNNEKLRTSSVDESQNLIQSARGYILTTSFLQLIVKVLSFLVNWIVLRTVDPSSWTLASVHLALLHSMALCVIREPLRKAFPPTRPNSITDLLFLTVPTSTFVILFLCFIWIFLGNHDPFACCLYAAAAWIELLTEPVQIISLSKLMFSQCAVIEAFAVVISNVVHLSLTLMYPTRECYLFFGYGLICQALFTFIMHYSLEVLRNRTTKHRVFRCAMAHKGIKNFTGDALAVWRAFMSQCFVKHLLSEGNALLMTFGLSAMSLEEQARSESISRLWSLVARFIYAPIEQASYVILSQATMRSFVDVNKESAVVLLRSKSVNRSSCMRNNFIADDPESYKVQSDAKKRVRFKSSIDVRICNVDDNDDENTSPSNGIHRRTSLREMRKHRSTIISSSWDNIGTVNWA
ncbi:hypothetical protein ACOME3_009119 [Neoechinorhynchus agilis]